MAAGYLVLAVLALPAGAMEKGTVKFFNETKGFGITTGGLEDEKTGKMVSFAQAGFKELGFGEGSEVRFELVPIAGQKSYVAVYLDPKNGPPAQKAKGRIKDIKDSGTGNIIARDGTVYEFLQPFAKELGLAPGVEVEFQLIEVQEGKKGLNAVNVKKA